MPATPRAVSSEIRLATWREPCGEAAERRRGSRTAGHSPSARRSFPGTGASWQESWFSSFPTCSTAPTACWRDLRGIQSPVGHLLDFLMDEIKAFVLRGAVAVRLLGEHQDVRFLMPGIAGLVCLASGIALTTFQRRPEVVTWLSGCSPGAPAAAAERGARQFLKTPRDDMVAFGAIAGGSQHRATEICRSSDKARALATRCQRGFRPCASQCDPKKIQRCPGRGPWREMVIHC